MISEFIKKIGSDQNKKMAEKMEIQTMEMAAKKKVEMKANKKLIFLLNSSHSCGISS
jgi:7-cyano-7-deazaguanine synthase in queuosine biosynthesis